MIFLDGVYIDGAPESRARFRWVKAPTSDELTQLTHTIAHRVARLLERQGLVGPLWVDCSYTQWQTATFRFTPIK